MKPPQEIIRKDLETLLRTLKEAITEARAAGATEVQIAGIVAAAENMAAQQAQGADLDWLVAQIRVAAEPSETLH
jgi:hypothetical protein